MALQMYGAVPRTSAAVHHPPLQGIIPKQATVVSVAGDYYPAQAMKRKMEGRRLSMERWRVSSSPSVTEVGQVTEVDKDTFWPIVNSAGDKTVVLDMYTQWCGPCKVMAPKFQKLAEKYEDVIFLKLDCNQENRPLAKELGIKVVPTFKILKQSKIVKEVTGAKLDDLVHAIENV